MVCSLIPSNSANCHCFNSFFFIASLISLFFILLFLSYKICIDFSDDDDYNCIIRYSNEYFQGTQKYQFKKQRNEEVSQAVVKASDANTMFTDEYP
nr:MAG TPA: hypothetical protein [Caudoviricetes sp.]